MNRAIGAFHRDCAPGRSVSPWRCSFPASFDGRGAAALVRSCLRFTTKLKGKEENLPKEDAIEVTGKVVEKFKAGMFSIELESGPKVLATMAGRLRRNRIKIMNGDRVSLELSPYDLTKGRITYRHK
jgi:translation initiation factor IF-1